MSDDKKKTITVSINEGYQPKLKTGIEGYKPKPKAGYKPEKSELEIKPPPKKK